MILEINKKNPKIQIAEQIEEELKSNKITDPSDLERQRKKQIWLIQKKESENISISSTDRVYFILVYNLIFKLYD